MPYTFDSEDDMEKKKIDWSQVKIEWHNHIINDPNIETLIREDCEQSLDGLGSVKDLIFHTITTGKGYDEDIIQVWGDGETDVLHAEFESEPKWLTADELKSKFDNKDKE